VEVSVLQSAKLAVMSLTNLSRDALHVHAGLLVFVLAAAVLRKHPGSPWPWLVAMVVACGMEAMDAVDGIVSYGHWRVRASVHDVVNTMFWPTALALACRFTRLCAPGDRARREMRE
jgi:hypothetical protein